MVEIKVVKDDSLREHDTGGGMRDVRAVVSIDTSLPLRRQREVLIYEILGTMLGYVISHEHLEEIAAYVAEGIDQLDGDNI